MSGKRIKWGILGTSFISENGLSNVLKKENIFYARNHLLLAQMKLSK